MGCARSVHPRCCGKPGSKGRGEDQDMMHEKQPRRILTVMPLLRPLRSASLESACMHVHCQDSHRLFMLLVEELGKVKDENKLLSEQMAKQEIMFKQSIGLLETQMSAVTQQLPVLNKALPKLPGHSDIW
eukprot:363066-Chlamydomonas_euryale.AAC.14